MLVVADKAALGVGRERGLARARKAKEEGNIPILADVGRAVHGHHALIGQEEVHHREDRLLHLTGIFGAHDDDLAPLKAEGDDGVALLAVLFAVISFAGKVHDHPIRLEIEKLVAVRANEKLLDEQGVVGALNDDAHLDAVVGVGAGKGVDDEDFAAVDDILSAVVQSVKLGGVHRGVAVPPNLLVGSGLIHDPLVLRSAAGVFAGVGHHGAVACKEAASLLDAQLGQLGGGQIAVDVRGKVGVQMASLRHDFLLARRR